MKRAARFVPLVLLVLSCRFDQPAAPATSLQLHQAAADDACPAEAGDKRAEIVFLCAIEIPGNPLTSSAKGIPDPGSGLYFLTDASNSGLDLIDMRTHRFVERIGGFAGVQTPTGTAASNGTGPSNIVLVPKFPGGQARDAAQWSDQVLWVSDGNSRVHVVDIASRQIVATISTAIPECDGGVEGTHFCGRANEIAYDPVHKIVLVSNPAPLTLTSPHVLGTGYATFISARYPYEVLGHIFFPGAGNVEGHIWVAELQRFLLPIQPTAANRSTRGTMYIAVVNPTTLAIEDKRVYYCPDIPGVTATSTGNNNLQLAPRGNLWAQMCGRPIRMDVRTGEIKNVVTQVGTGDQDWYNPGDGNFYVTGTDPATGAAAVGVMDGTTGEWKQNVPNPVGANVSANAHTNEIFTRVQVNAAIVANPATDQSRCVVKGRGCVVVFKHAPR